MKPDDTSSNETPTELATDEHATSRQESTQRPGPAAIPDRYAAITLTHGESIVYEQGNPDMWIQSDMSRPIEEMI